MARARAMATRCFSPPDRSAGRWCRRVAEADFVRGPRWRASWPGLAVRPWYFRTTSTCCRARQRREQVEALEDEAAVVEAELVDLAGRQLPQVIDIERVDAALFRAQQAGQGGDQGRLARAGRAHDHGQVAVPGVEVDALQHLDEGLAGLEALDQALGLDGEVAVLAVDLCVLDEVGHRSRSAGWLFLRMPSDSRPDTMAMTIRPPPTTISRAVGEGDEAPPCVAAQQRQTAMVRAIAARDADEADPEAELHDDRSQRAHADAQGPQRGELLDVGHDGAAQGLPGDGDADDDAQHDAAAEMTTRMPSSNMALWLASASS